MSFLSRTLPPLLLLLHAGLLLWATVGWIEWFASTVPWTPLSNPLFPQWVLFLHWSAVAIASALFLWGYATRWKHTPVAMIPAYGFMAIVCFIETIWFMESPYRYLAMAAEYAAYAGILWMLFRMPRLADRFQKSLGKA